MQQKSFLIFLLLFIYAIIVQGQNTVGLKYNSEDATNGYVLISSYQNQNTYLIDNCGFIINQWQDGALPQLTSYLNEQGDVIRSTYGLIQRHNWDGNLEWAISLNSIDITNHHDIEVLPSGNILVIAGEYYSKWSAIENGRDSMNVDEGGRLDGIIEIQPIDADSAAVVWEWNIKDHLVQDYDSSKNNYGVIAEHPELLDINFEQDFVEIEGSMYDWIHLNSVDYNQSLDQILISSRHSSELYIIDHSTTTQEAAGHTGGLYNKGGDFLWRWGNDQIYDRGTESDRFLSGQHDPRWIDESYENGGMISVFNNGAFTGDEKSSLCIIDPSLSPDGSYEKLNDVFLPQDFYWAYESDASGETFFAATESGATPLSNGNVLGVLTSGEFFEVNPDGETVWSYQSPVGSIIVSQGNTGPTPLFKAQKYESDFNGFLDKNLVPGTTIENVNTVSDSCEIFIINGIVEIPAEIRIYPNPVSNFIVVESHENQELSYHIWDRWGNEIKQFNKAPIEISELSPNFYFLEIRTLDKESLGIFKFIKQ